MNNGKWNFNIPWIPCVISFPIYIERSLLANSVISYGHKRKIDLELKLTFFNLNYEKITKNQFTILVFWAKPERELLSFLLPRDYSVKMQHFGSLISFYGLSNWSLLFLQAERRWQEFAKVPRFSWFSNAARVTGLEISPESFKCC